MNKAGANLQCEVGERRVARRCGPPGQARVGDGQGRQTSVELLGYVFAWILDRIVPSLRAAWGNLGCLLVSILAAGVLVWFLPAYVLDGSGGDWKTWLIVGPLATFAVVVMVAGTYGLARGSRSKQGEMAVGESHGDQEPAEGSIMEGPLARDIKASVRATPKAIAQSVQTGTKECPHCGEQVSSRAIACRHCNEWLMDRPYAVKAAEKKPAPELLRALKKERPWGMVWALVLGAPVALALPVAALVARAMACGPLHSSVVVFGLLTLAISVPGATLPAALAWSLGRRRHDGRGTDTKDLSVPRALAGGLLGVIISFAASAVCALMVFFPECL